MTADNGRDGPWVKLDRGTWRLRFTPDDLRTRYYDLEYRRAEPDCDSGYYLFGPHGDAPFLTAFFDGVRMDGPSASMARYEAFYRVMQTVDLPRPFDALETS